VTGRPTFQNSSTMCEVTECDREASVMRGPWPFRGCCAMVGKIALWWLLVEPKSVALKP
jgi:hypothetical protein